MLWFRYLGTSFLQWVTTYLVTAVVMAYLLPKTWTGYSLAAIAWLVSFMVAFAFAEWAFGTQIPGRQETAALLLIWMTVTVSIYIFYFWYFFGTIAPFVGSIDTYIQLLLETVAILLAAYLTRRRKIKATFGEGLAE